MNITWFHREKIGFNAKADVTVSVTKKSKTGRITLRNNLANEISPDSHYMVLGVPSEDANVLCFMASKERDGWKASQSKNSDTAVLQFSDERMLELCARFAGDYKVDLYEDTGTELYCINRRNVL